MDPTVVEFCLNGKVYMHVDLICVHYLMYLQCNVLVENEREFRVSFYIVHV